NEKERAARAICARSLRRAGKRRRADGSRQQQIECEHEDAAEHAMLREDEHREGVLGVGHRFGNAASADNSLARPPPQKPALAYVFPPQICSIEGISRSRAEPGLAEINNSSASGSSDVATERAATRSIDLLTRGSRTPSK